MLSHTSLGIYYKTLFSLAQHHKYSIGELESILPFERDLYVEMLVEYMEELKAKQETQ